MLSSDCQAGITNTALQRGLWSSEGTKGTIPFVSKRPLCLVKSVGCPT